MKKETKQEIKKDMDDVTKKTKRAIEFRAKKLDIVTLKPTNEWVYGYLMRGANDDEFMIQEKSKRCHLVDGNTIGEYTGLTDKNGTKIFEGDIVKLDGEFVIRCPYLAVVEFGNLDDSNNWGWQLCKNSMALTLSLIEDDMMSIEVIGNIHDNPELLEQKE